MCICLSVHSVALRAEVWDCIKVCQANEHRVGHNDVRCRASNSIPNCLSLISSHLLYGDVPAFLRLSEATKIRLKTSYWPASNPGVISSTILSILSVAIVKQLTFAIPKHAYWTKASDFFRLGFSPCLDRLRSILLAIRIHHDKSRPYHPHVPVPASRSDSHFA